MAVAYFETFDDLEQIPGNLKKHFVQLEDFVNSVDGEEVTGGTMDASDAVAAFNGLVFGIRRLQDENKEQRETLHRLLNYAETCFVERNPVKFSMFGLPPWLASIRALYPLAPSPVQENPDAVSAASSE